MLFIFLILSLVTTIFLTLIYNYFFENKEKITNRNMFKLIGNSGMAETDISELFGVVSFKDDFNLEKKIICYSYREKILKGNRVLITDYDQHKEMYVIDEYPR